MAREERLFAGMSARELQDLRAAKTEWSNRLLQAPRIEAARRGIPKMEAARALTAAVNPTPSQNVVGVGVGEKITDGRHTGSLAVKFFVRLKYGEAELDSKSLLPKTIDGLPVDVEESGLFRRFRVAAVRRKVHGVGPMPNPRVKIRPAQPGCSVGFRDPNNQFVMAGTFGALVTDKTSPYILSNNHVLADENRLPVGSPIFQPGLLDGGDPTTDQIAELTRAVLLQATVTNKVDCAIAKALKASLVSKEILYIGAPQGTVDAHLDMVVHKFGRTTSYRVGRVTSIDTDVTVQYETGNFTFGEQIIVVGLDGHPFSDAGDSGSLILERASNRATGLLFAGSRSHTIANHIGDVLQALNVTLS